MAAFRPARNREHPGDSPPKSPPISRTRRLFLDVTVIAGIIIGLMLMTARTAGASNDTDLARASPSASSPSWDGGQRIELPDAGFAVTFPRDWTIELVAEGFDPAILVLAQPERFGPEVELQRLLVAWGPGGREREQPLGCTLVWYAPIEVTADEFLHKVFQRSDELVVERLDDRSSRVLVNPFLQSRILLDNPEANYGDNYAIGADSSVAVLMCHGVASHRDDWLSIAESFEPLSES